MWLRDVPGVVTAAQLDATVDSLTAVQLDDGMIPWFALGHADPWNHVEAAMALQLGGRTAAVERAWEWLARHQRPDGSWHRYYVAGGVEEDKLDANCCAYPAAGLWHRYLCCGDVSVLRAYWPMVEGATEFVLDLQTPRGEVLWARHADGTPWPFALLTGSSSISHSLACALAIASELGVRRPRWELALARLRHVIRCVPDAFAPKARWAMDWYYPVLVGALSGQQARERLARGWDRFVLAGRGVRCVADEDWVTAAETCECALAHLAAGDEQRAWELFGWAHTHRTTSGSYWTGLVQPGSVVFPADEQSSYTGAAVVLCADALTRASPASGLFTDHTSLPVDWS